MTRHVGARLSAYVDRLLDPVVLREIDRHLVACQVCRCAVEEERRLLASLRYGVTPRLSEGLQASLLSLAGSGELGPGLSLAGSRTAPVPTVSPTGPGLHRSPRRAAGLAGFAAGASAAAAIGLAVAGPAAAPLRGPSPRPAGLVSASVPDSPVGGAGTALVGFTRLPTASAGAVSDTAPIARPVDATVWTRPTTRGR